MNEKEEVLDWEREGYKAWKRKSKNEGFEKVSRMREGDKSKNESE